MPEKEPVSLSAGEWRIMECLWAESPRTVMQMVNSLKDRTGWAKSTITTMIRRMETKGILYYRNGRKAREYYPAVSREEAAIFETESLLDRAYRGSIGMLVNTLAKKKRLSKEEIAALYAILQKAEEAKKE